MASKMTEAGIIITQGDTLNIPLRFTIYKDGKKVFGIGGGLLTGILLHKLCTLVLYKLVRFPAPFGIA